jgi:hypothetical protein
MALMDAGIAMRTILLSIDVAVTEGGDIILDPSADKTQPASNGTLVVHSFVLYFLSSSCPISCSYCSFSSFFLIENYSKLLK